MALPDPFAVTTGGTYGLTGGAVKNFARIEPGKFILDSSSADEPYYMTVKSTIRSNGQASDYLWRFDRHKNPAAGLPVGSPDATLSAYLVLRSDWGAFGSADALDILTAIGNISYNSGQLTKFLRGER